MSARARRRLLEVIAWVLVAGLLWFALRDLSWEGVRTALAELSLLEGLVLVVVNTGIVLLLGSRWWLILRARGHRIGFLDAAGYRLAAFGVSYFTPGPHIGGEPLQVVLLGRREGITAGPAAAAVLLDKLFELSSNFAFLTFGVAALISSGRIDPAIGGLGLLLAAAAALAVPVYLGLTGAGRSPLGRLAGWSARRVRAGWLRRAAGFMERVEAEAAMFVREDRAAFVMAVLLSALIWAALILEYALALRFLGQSAAGIDVIRIMAAARLAILLPLPGGLGALEVSLVLVMQAVSGSAALGAGLSLLIRVRDVLFGLLGLWLGRRMLNHSTGEFGRKRMMLQLQREVCARIPTDLGKFQLYLYTNNQDEKEHLALVMGDVAGQADVLVRVHSECLTGDIFGSQRCDCGEQLQRALEWIAEAGQGVLLYLRQEGRGIGLLDKLHAYNLQDEGYDTVDANILLGHQADERDYSAAALILEDLGIQSIRLLTNNPAKIQSLEGLGMAVMDRVEFSPAVNPENARYLRTKITRMNHIFDLSSNGAHHQDAHETGNGSVAPDPEEQG